eukprot:Selendium_serpulae@DN3538_c0_g1_i1.p1
MKLLSCAASAFRRAATKSKPAPCSRFATPFSSVGSKRFFASNDAEFADPYFNGLRYAPEFVNEPQISSESKRIPIFRIMDYEGNLLGDWENKIPMTVEEIKTNYQFMVKLSVWDDMMYNIQRQGRISFYIQNDGEESLQTGVGAALKLGDNLFCQYRELGVLMYLGFTLDNALDQLLSKAGDPGKGRQMPISYTSRDIGLHTVATPLTTQLPHAAGAGYAFRVAGEDKVAVGFFGEGAASEGDFHAAMNFAAVRKAQTLFICRNNGYSISTPVKCQYSGDGIGVRGPSYGMETIRADGNDLLATYVATQKARQYCVEKQEPVLLEFMTYRMGHHSTSDESATYRPAGEMDSWTTPGIRPIQRVKLFLEKKGMMSQEEHEEIRKVAKKDMLAKLKDVEKRPRANIFEGMFEDVYDVQPWHIKEQAESLQDHLSKHPKVYERDMAHYIK